jgi:hypothetical protein
MERIIKFLTEQAKKYPIQAIEIRHSDESKVDRFVVAEGTTTLDLSALLWEAIETDNVFGTEQIYWLYFYREIEGQPASDVPECRKPLRISGAPLDAGHVSSTERADEQGLASQAMRHQEFNVQVIERLLVSSVKDAHEQNAKLHARLSQAAEREMDMLGLVRSHMLDQSQLELQKEAARQEAMMWQKFLEQGELLLPVLMSHVMKPKGENGESAQDLNRRRLEEDPPLELKLIGAFFATLEPEQYDKIGVVLNLAQRGALMELKEGNILPELVPVTVARVMNGLTEDQARSIYAELKTPEQIEAFRNVYSIRKLSLQWQKDSALAAAPAVRQINTPPVSEGASS